MWHKPFIDTKIIIQLRGQKINRFVQKFGEVRVQVEGNMQVQQICV